MFKPEADLVYEQMAGNTNEKFLSLLVPVLKSMLFGLRMYEDPAVI